MARDLAGALTATLLLACSGADEMADFDCPPAGTELTYESFGKPFFDRWCNGCHGGNNGYSSRSFTTIDNIRAQRERIFANSAAGNTSMPPGPDDPPDEDRDRLAEWLTCGAP